MEKHQSLNGWYKSLEKPVPPKKDFITRVAQRCQVEPYTVEIWIAGRSKPSKPEYYDILSEESGVPKDMLFQDETDEKR